MSCTRQRTMDALLQLAGSKLVLKDALDEMHVLELADPSPNGKAWAHRAIATIDLVRSRGRVRTPSGFLTLD